MSINVTDHTGQQFGSLTVIKQSGRDKWGQVKWECLCKCGKTIEVVGGNLRRKHGNKSCGCERKARTSEVNTTHGHTIRFGDHNNRIASREYRSWQAMKKRCYDPNQRFYYNYGGRGITVCDRWLNNFSAFLQDMGDRPVDSSLDRIDPNGIYEPSNCRWATRQQQARNRRIRVAAPPSKLGLYIDVHKHVIA